VIGATLGVEEEYHLVDPATFELLSCPELSRRALAGGAGRRIQPEMLTSQLEAATDACTSLDELHAALVSARREAALAAKSEGAVILATSTHPFARLAEIEVAPRPRYQRLIERFGTVVRQLNLCGCHVHVAVPDPDTAIAIMARARAYLPILLALTASSPFHEGIDTGLDSFRVTWLALWPQGGLPPAFDSAAQYRATAGQLVEAGLIDDPTALLWDVRPSARYPTLEFRIADSCPDVMDALLYAGLVRSLVRTLGVHVQTGQPGPDPPDLVLRAARWRAARFGLTDTLWSPARQATVPAGEAIDELWALLRPDLERHGEDEIVGGLLSRLRAAGNSAQRQRRTFAATGSLREVVRAAVQLTAGDA
jgi:carboxylate-amine ligase